MNESIAVLGAVLPVFLIAGAGVAMRKVNWLTEEADQSLLRVTINLLIPCLIFNSILKNDALRQWGNTVLAPLVGFGTIALGLGVALLMRRSAGVANATEQRTFAFTVGIYNYGYIPLPLATLLFDRETVGVLFVHNVGVEIAYWTLGLAVLRGQSFGSGGRRIFNPPLAAIVIALLLNFAGAHDRVPQAALTAIEMIGQCAIPMGLILIGAVVADHLHEFHSEGGWQVMIASCALRLAVLPLLFLLLAKFLVAPAELKRVMLLQAAMPSAVFAIVMAKHFDGDPPTALRVVIATSLVALVTIPLWLRFGMRWLGL